MTNDFYTIKVNEQKLKEIRDFYAPFISDKEHDYVFFVAKKDGTVITGYTSSKTSKKVTFQGKNALEEATYWDKEATTKPQKEKEEKKWLDYSDQIGSDEVGVGDFLLPMIVVASFVKESDIPYLIKLGVRDSKKLSDKKILEIGEELTTKFDYSKLTLTNEKYNEMISKGENLNSLKAKMHNRALYNMHKKYEDVVAIYVDQFVNEKTYYKYLNDKDEPEVKGIAFKTQGESYFPCVALSSVIARYSFLKEKEKLEQRYSMKFPFGADINADKFAKKFIKKFGFDELKKISKNNFANFKNLTKEELF